MNIGLLIRGAKAGAKLAGRGAKAAASKTKAGAKAAASKTKAAAKAAGKTKVVQGVKKAGGKVAEGVGYAATPGLRRSAKRGVRYFKKGKGTGPIKSVSRAAVRRRGKQVIGGAAAVGTGTAAVKVAKGRNNKKAAASKPAPAAKPSGKTTAPKKAPIKFGASPKAIDKSKPNKGSAAKTFAAAQAKKSSAPRGASAAGSRFDKMTSAQKNRLRGKDAAAYRKYLKSKKK